MRNDVGSETKSNPTGQYVILDWNIVQYWISKKMRRAISPVLTEVVEAGLQLAISEISVFEAQCQLPVTKHLIALAAIDDIPRFPIDTHTHLVTGTIVSCYKNHADTKSHAGEISLQDSFNAACALQNRAMLLTADFNDYPRPFFDEVARWEIQNDRGNHQKIYLLAPDYGQFDKHSSKWFEAAAASDAAKTKTRSN